METPSGSPLKRNPVINPMGSNTPGYENPKPVSENNDTVFGQSSFGGKRRRKSKRGGKWSRKYKRSINCRRPKGFSQRQHCKYGRRSRRR